VALFVFSQILSESLGPQRLCFIVFLFSALATGPFFTPPFIAAFAFFSIRSLYAVRNAPSILIP